MSKWMQFLAAGALVLVTAAPVLAQGHGKGKGSDKGHDKGKAPAHAAPQVLQEGQGREKAHGNSTKQEHYEGHAQSAKGNGNSNWKKDDDDWKKRNDDWKHSAPKSSFRRVFTQQDVYPRLRQYVVSARAPERVVAGAIARAYARGVNDDVFVITPNGNIVRITNRSGAELLNLDDEHARNLGAWDVTPLSDTVGSQAPAFCRSGAGHPVFGRQWCIDKGFGLGGNGEARWARTTNASDIAFVTPVTTGRLTRSALVALLGDVAFNRLALHAVTLGYSDPLSGVWAGDATGPRVLQLSAGSYPVAEIVDTNRDNRADMLVVALRPW